MKLYDLPPAIQLLALRRQKEAGNPENAQLYLLTKKCDGGFDWHDTPEGVHFWTKIFHGDFRHYFRKYDIDSIIDKTLKEAQLVLSEHSEDELRRALKVVLVDNLIA